MKISEAPINELRRPNWIKECDDWHFVSQAVGIHLFLLLLGLDRRQPIDISYWKRFFYGFLLDLCDLRVSFDFLELFPEFAHGKLPSLIILLEDEPGSS